MNYAELVRDTKEMTQRMTLKWDVISCILIALMALLAIIGLRLIWEEHRDRKARKAARWNGKEYLPTVTDTVQYDQFGTEFHRMGVPGREA